MTEPSTPARKRSRKRAETTEPDAPAEVAVDAPAEVAADSPATDTSSRGIGPAGSDEALTAAEADAAAEAAEIVATAALPVSAGSPDTRLSTPTSALVETMSLRDLDRVHVGRLNLERGGIGEATADAVDVRMGGVGRLDARDVSVQFGGVGVARADVLNVTLGGVGPVAAGEAHVSRGVVGNLLARDATIDQGFIRTLIAQRVTVTRPSAALVVLAARVDGEVRALLDWRGALALGLGFGLVAALSRALRRER